MHLRFPLTKERSKKRKITKKRDLLFRRSNTVAHEATDDHRLLILNNELRCCRSFGEWDYTEGPDSSLRFTDRELFQFEPHFVRLVHVWSEFNFRSDVLKTRVGVETA